MRGRGTVKRSDGTSDTRSVPYAYPGFPYAKDMKKGRPSGRPF